MRRQKDCIIVKQDENKKWYWEIHDRHDKIILQSTEKYELRSYIEKQVKCFCTRHDKHTFDIEITNSFNGNADPNTKAWTKKKENINPNWTNARTWLD